jgi:hypothetical protein
MSSAWPSVPCKPCPAQSDRACTAQLTLGGWWAVQVTALLAYVTSRAVNIRQGSFYDIHSFGKSISQ